MHPTEDKKDTKKSDHENDMVITDIEYKSPEYNIITPNNLVTRNIGGIDDIINSINTVNIEDQK